MIKNKAFTVIAAVVALCVIASTVTGIISVISMKSMRNEIAGFTGDGEDVAQEDDITIMGEYRVESTKKISDAYKKGSDSRLNDREKETLKMASDIISEIITDDMSDYDKEKAVYDWLVANVGQDTGLLTVIPTSEEDSDNPYGVLKYHDAVCVGYATTFRLFMEMMDIECMVVHNTEMYHTWNLVKLDDGWYHTDVYSDSETGNYANFNMTDEIAADGHDWNRDFFPAADGFKYCYAFMNENTAKDIFDIPSVVKKAMDDGKFVFSIAFDKQPSDDDAAVVSTMMSSLSDRIMMDYPESYMTWSWHTDENSRYVLLLNINVPQTADTSISPEDAEKIGRKIAKAFGDSEDWPVSYDDSSSYDMNDPAVMKKMGK